MNEGGPFLENKRRIGINEGEFVVLDRTHKGISRNKDIFHGHVERWEDLRQPMRDALEKAGLTDKKGKILKK